MNPEKAPEAEPRASLVPPGIKSLIIQRARIDFVLGTPTADSERALEVMKVLTPNNIFFSEIRRSGSRDELLLSYSLPLSRLRFVQMIDVMKSSGIAIEGWERLG